MTLCFYHRVCEQHDPGFNHSENKKRLISVMEALKAQDMPGLRFVEMPLGMRASIELVHTKDYVDFVFASVPQEGVREIEINEIVSDHDDGEVTCLSPHSGEALLRCAGAAVAAVDAVMRGQDTRAFCATRPPGHHALANKAMGFCIFHHGAIAARYAQSAYNIKKIVFVDFDAHHGNGTQQIFENDPSVCSISVHQLPLWPESGFEHEVGCGNILNTPMPPDISRAAWLDVWKERVLPRIEQERPELLIVLAGFDAHKNEPKTDQPLETEDYARITRDLVLLAERYARGRLISFLEGGYDLPALAQSVVAHVSALDAF